MIRKRWAVLVLAGAIGLVLGAASMVLAGATVITAQANSLAVIKTLALDGDPSTTSTSFVDVPGVARNATSTGTSNLFIAEFNARVDVGTSGSDTACLVRIAVKDNAGTTVGFMNPDGNGILVGDDDEVVEVSHIERSLKDLAPGTYTFQVQFRVDLDPGICQLLDIHYTLARYV